MSGNRLYRSNPTPASASTLFLSPMASSHPIYISHVNPKWLQIFNFDCAPQLGLLTLYPLGSPSFLSRFRPLSVSVNSISAPILRSDSFIFRFGSNFNLKIRRKQYPVAAVMLLPDNPVLSDICATALAGSVALSLLRLWAETAKRGLDQKLNRKLVHISIGLAFMLCWPMFSSGRRGAILASLIPGVNIIRMLVLGLGIMKDEATVKSMSRYGDYRELLKGPLYYVATITLVCIFYWRTSPISIALICNLCAGDGLADVLGRRFGTQKISYNKNKSLVGSVAMASAGFLASVGYMYYFSSFGYVEGSSRMVLGFLVVSLASALVESLPISTEIDDNLTVPLTSFLVGSLVF